MGQKQTKILKLAALAIATVLVFSLGYYVGANPAGPDVYLDDLPSPYSYVIKTDGSEVWAVRYDGHIPSGMASTDAYVVFTAVRDAIVEYGTVAVRHGDYTFSQTFTSTKHLRIMGEGSGTRLLNDGAYAAINPANLELWNVAYEDENGIINEGFDFANPYLSLFHSDAFFWQGHAESLDGFVKSTGASVIEEEALYRLDTAATVNDEQYIGKVRWYRPLPKPSWLKTTRFKGTLNLNGEASNREDFVGVGSAPFSTAQVHMGFYINDGLVYGSVGDGVTYAQLNTGLALNGSSFYDFEIVLVPQTEVRFYMMTSSDAAILTYLGRVTENIPETEDMDIVIFGMWLKTKTAQSISLEVGLPTFLQEP